MPSLKFNKLVRIGLTVLSSLLALVIIILAIVYLWPLKTKSLQTAHPQTMTYQQATTQVDALRADEQHQGVRPECLTTLYSHGSKTAKTVVMIHGTGACPQQFDALGKYFYEKGYNVLVPRTPHFGMADNKEHGKATAQEMTAFADSSITIATGLGDEVGVMGLSGGGVLATWATHYRPDVVNQLTVLSPFYAPSTQEVPAWQQPLLAFFFGYGILPDQFSEPWGLSYHALGQYLRISANLKDKPVSDSLHGVASVISAGDNSIDKELAKSVPTNTAATNNRKAIIYTPPEEWGLGHDIVGTVNNNDINGHQDDLFPIYYRLHNGSDQLQTN